MATRKTMSVSISPELVAFAESLRASGRYSNISEVVRTALRQMEERELDFQAHRDKRDTHRLEEVDQAGEQVKGASHV